MRARPELGRRNPSSVRINVDLPAPLGPSNPTAFPAPDAPRRQVIPWRISRRPSRTFRLSSSTTGVAAKPLLMSRGRLAQTVEQHEVHDQTGDTSTAACVDLFLRSIEHHEDRIVPGHELAEG